MICELLGLPDEDRETFRQLGSARFDVTHGGQARRSGAVGESREFLLAEARRQRSDPGAGLIGQIIREHGDEINDFDLGGLADGVVHRRPRDVGLDARARHRRAARPPRGLYAGVGDRPGRHRPVVEELLRYLSVVQVAFPRFAKTRGRGRRPADLAGRRA